MPSSAQEFEIITWDDSYAVAKALRRSHPQANLVDISLGMIYEWTLALPEFDDDPRLANEAILTSIYRELLEEENPL